MTLIRRTSMTVAALAIALAAPLSSAHAASWHWKTEVVVVKAKLQMCKIGTTKAGPYKVHVRVDATNASGPVTGLAQVTKNGKDTSSKWATKGYVKRGSMSAVGTVMLPQDAKYAVTAGMGTGAMGDGGSFVAKQIPHC